MHRIFLAAIFLIATPSIAVPERIAITLGQAINAADLIASGEIPEISTIENRVIESMGKSYDQEVEKSTYFRRRAATTSEYGMKLNQLTRPIS